MGNKALSLLGAGLLAWCVGNVAVSFVEPAIFAAALSVGVWPWAKKARALAGRRASSLALSCLIVAGAGAPGAWAWNYAFKEIDAIIIALPSQARDGAEWIAEIKSAASRNLAGMRQAKAWRERAAVSNSMPWGSLGLVAILLYFMLADGVLALGWIHETAKRLGPIAEKACQAGWKAFEQTAKACLWFGGASLFALWGLFWWAGAPSPLAFAVAGACASMIPFVGPIMVGAVSLSLMDSARVAGPLALLVIGGGGLGLANNILRPKWIGDASGLPMPMALLGMAGGAFAWGPAGLLAGPGIVACALACAGSAGPRPNGGEGL